MTRYDQWKTQTPEDEQDEREEAKAKEAAKLERQISELED